MSPGIHATVGQLFEHGVTVWWKCQQCLATGDADLEAIIAAKGRDYRLADRTAACRQPGCTYWVGFYARAGLRNWPLRTEAGMLRQMDRRSAWLTEKWRREGLV